MWYEDSSTVTVYVKLENHRLHLVQQVNLYNLKDATEATGINKAKLTPIIYLEILTARVVN